MKTNLSLRTKIIGMVLGVITILGVASYVNMQHVISSYKNDLNESIQGYAISLGDKIAAMFYERYGDVQAFAINPSIKSLDGTKMQGDLDQYVPLYGIYDLIIVVDKHGYLVGANSKDINGKPVNLKALQAYNFKEAPWFKAKMP